MLIVARFSFFEKWLVEAFQWLEVARRGFLCFFFESGVARRFCVCFYVSACRRQCSQLARLMF